MRLRELDMNVLKTASDIIIYDIFIELLKKYRNMNSKIYYYFNDPNRENKKIVLYIERIVFSKGHIILHSKSDMGHTFKHSYYKFHLKSLLDGDGSGFLYLEE